MIFENDFSYLIGLNRNYINYIILFECLFELNLFYFDFFG